MVTASPYINCTSSNGYAIDVRVSTCTKSPCILKKGGSVSIEVDFIPTVDATYLTDRVRGIIAGIKLPFATENPNGCQDKGITCPLKKGRRYTYKSVIPVSNLYPSLRLIVEWALIDQNDAEVFCVKIPAQIKALIL